MATSVAPGLSTVDQIRQKIRRLCASSSESELTTADIDQYINTYYSQDFPYSVKLDQTRNVYTFYTEPYIDTYPIDVNYNQGIRAPFYVDGVLGNFYKDRNSFYNIYPRWPTLFHPINGDGITTLFNFTIGPTPFLRNEVTLGGVSTTGAAISVQDDGKGNLQYALPNPQTIVPPYTAVYPVGDPNAGKPIPGMHNANTGNPGLNTLTNIGTVNYVSGAFSLDFSIVGVVPVAGKPMTLRVSQYQPGRPSVLLFWNNELVIRPVPKFIHKITVETYLTPVQFMLSTDTPIINQWWQLIAIGAAIKAIEDRQDMKGIDNLVVIFDRQESLVLERQGVEEIGQRNSTIFSGTQQSGNWNNSWGQGGGW